MFCRTKINFMGEKGDVVLNELEIFHSALQAAMEGDLSSRVNVASDHPLFALAEQFNKFLGDLEERDEEEQRYLDSTEQSIIELRGAYEELTTLQLLSVTINTTFEKDEVLNLFINLLHEIIDYRACCLLIPDGEQFAILTSRNLTATLESGIRNDKTHQLLQWCCKESKVVPLTSEEFVEKDLQNEKEALSYLAVPLTSHNEALGVLILECETKEKQFTQQKLTLVSLLAAQTGTACENADLYKDMKQTNINLSYLKNYLQNILEHVTTGIITLDKQGHVTTLNKMAERIFSISADEAKGKPFYHIFKDPIRTSMRHLVMSTMLNQEVLNLDIEYPTLDERILSLSFNTSLLREEDDTVIGFVIACRDITETKELDAMKKLSQLKSEFLSSVSHELRTPLTSIKAYSETLLTRYERMPTEMRLDCLSIIDSESDRLARLLDDLLDFARMEAGRLKLKKDWIDLEHLVLSTAEEMKMQTKKHTIRIVIPDSVPRVMADRDRIKQALINLLSNAIKYSPEGGDIVASMELRTKEAVVSVTDQGVGIDEENLPRIFEKFYRVEGPLAYQISGTGLGLPITKAIIEGHGGQIWATSKIGEGTTISFSLPIDTSL